jgi:hypothetical protein
LNVNIGMPITKLNSILLQELKIDSKIPASTILFPYIIIKILIFIML